MSLSLLLTLKTILECFSVDSEDKGVIFRFLVFFTRRRFSGGPFEASPRPARSFDVSCVCVCGGDARTHARDAPTRTHTACNTSSLPLLKVAPTNRPGRGHLISIQTAFQSTVAV